MERLKFYKISKKPSQKKALIFFHGWKGNKKSFTNLPSILNLDNVDWYFPEGPYISEGNKEEKSWAQEIEPGIFSVDKTKVLLNLFIKENILTDYNLENVFIMGFSQGAAVCYELFLDKKYIWGGVFPVAGFLRDSKRDIILNNKINNL